MNKIGLKLWNINTDYYYQEAKKMYGDNIFDYIELYIVPNHIDLIDIWKKLDIPFDIHAPHFAHNMNLSKSDFAQDNCDKYIEVKQYADELNANIIVFHSGIGGSYVETANQLSKFNDNRIIVENKPMRPLKLMTGELCIGYKYDEIKYIIEKTNYGFCLDIGHAICSANSQNLNPYEYIKKFLELKPKRIHLSDIHIDSLTDEHLNYGKGTLNFKKVLSLLPKEICITIETTKKSKTDLDDYREDALFLKDMLQNLK